VLDVFLKYFDWRLRVTPLEKKKHKRKTGGEYPPVLVVSL